MSKQSNPHTARRDLRRATPALLVASISLFLIFSGASKRLVIRQSGSVKGAALAHTLTVSAGKPGRMFAPGTIGLSIEAEELATRDLHASHESLVALMRLLGPAVLRVGGNSLDRSWWTSDAEPAPGWATSVITPTDLANLRELLAAADWQVILGVDLGHFDAARAADETRAAVNILGSRLVGIELGNEPDLYSSSSVKLRGDDYNASTYLKEVSAYSSAIHEVSAAMPLYGPELSPPTSWLTPIAVETPMPFAVLTEHYYSTSYNRPLGGCKGTPLPTAPELLSEQVRERENAIIRTLVSAGELAHRPTRISETNSTASCDDSGGPDTGPVFASALWSLDWALRAANAGVGGLNFHGYFGLCAPGSYSPICAPTNAAEARGQVAAHPEYYGLLAARELEGGRFLPVEIDGQNSAEELTAYATEHDHNVVTLVIDNLAINGPTSIVLRVPGYRTATSETLAGPSINATRGVTLGHASFNAAGMLRPKRAKIPGLRGVFRLKLAPTSAVVITLRR